MKNWEKLIYALPVSEQAFVQALKETLSHLKITIEDLSQGTGLSKSSLYKITSTGAQNPTFATLHKIVAFVRQQELEEETDDHRIALITERNAIEKFRDYHFDVGDSAYRIKTYSAQNVEEAIGQALQAQAEGVKAVICGPITAYVVEKLLDIPVISIKPSATEVQRAIELAAEVIRGAYTP